MSAAARRVAVEAAPAGADAITTLTWHYEHPRAEALAQHRRGVPVVGVTSNTVPWEIVRAAGAFPVLVTAAHETTPLADPFMEPVFDGRIRSIFEDLLAGRWSFLQLLVAPRTSEWEHKLYLYLLEVRRQGGRSRATGLPVPFLFDLLHTRSVNAARHGLERTEDFRRALAAVTKRRAGARELAVAIRDSNRAREAVRRLLRFRRGPAPRLSGTEALALVGAWYFMDRRDYARLAGRAAEVVARRPPIRGPHVLVKGSPLDHRGLHRAIERHGAVVVAEDDWWGSRSAARDVVGEDRVAAIFRKYYTDASSPRVFPSSLADRWFEREVRRGINGVVYYLPPDDDVLGWDYPRHKRFLDAHGVPVTLVREDARRLSPAVHEQLAAFVPWTWDDATFIVMRIKNPPVAKQLETTRLASEHQKAWFAELRASVFEGGAPYTIVQADMPLELFSVMDVPVISNQWWAALISAKQLAGDYLDALNSAGYHDGLCRYCSLSLGCTLADDGRAPWGGLPKPAILSARLTCDCIQRVFETWASALGAPFVPLDNPGAAALPPRWWELSRHRWTELFESHRLDFMVSELKRLARRIERLTGQRLDLDRLRERMEAVNRQEEYFDEARELICHAPRTPVRLQEQISNVMTTQWHRGGEWAVAHARAFRDEVRMRVEANIAAVPGERLRLMWIGAGLWHDTSFYTDFEVSHGAVFVWSMYLAFGPDGYIRYGLDDPMRALASRVVSMNEQLHNPPWANEWMVDQARRHRIDAALILVPTGTRPSATGSFFIQRALEDAGIRTLLIWTDMVDPRGWEPEGMRAQVGAFLDGVPTP